MACVDGGVDRAIEVLRANEGVLAQRLHSRATINALLSVGAVQRVFPGVFVDVHLLANRRTRYLASLIARPTAVLWGDSAATVLRGDARAFAAGEVIHLAQACAGAVPRGLRMHRRAVPEIRLFDGLRCPAPAIVAVDTMLRDDGRLAESLLRSGLVRPRDLLHALEYFVGSPGQAERRRLVVSFADNPWSGGERDLQAVLRGTVVTGWVANAPIRACGHVYHPDLLFEAARLVVEFDGFAVHGTREAFESDRIRQNHLVLAGYRVLRYTWQRLQHDPQGIVDEICAALAMAEPVVC